MVTALPLSCVHTPVPVDGVLPVRFTELYRHTFCFDPPFETVGAPEIFIVTLLLLLQTPFIDVHWKT